MKETSWSLGSIRVVVGVWEVDVESSATIAFRITIDRIRVIGRSVNMTSSSAAAEISGRL